MFVSDENSVMILLFLAIFTCITVLLNLAFSVRVFVVFDHIETFFKLVFL